MSDNSCIVCDRVCSFKFSEDTLNQKMRIYEETLLATFIQNAQLQYLENDIPWTEEVRTRVLESWNTWNQERKETSGEISQAEADKSAVKKMILDLYNDKVLSTSPTQRTLNFLGYSIKSFQRNMIFPAHSFLYDLCECGPLGTRRIEDGIKSPLPNDPPPSTFSAAELASMIRDLE